MPAETTPVAIPSSHAELHQLRADEERLRIAVETAQLGTWQFDIDSGEMQASALCKAHFGRGPEDDFTYDDLIDALHFDEDSAEAQARRKAMKDGSIYRAEYRIVWPDDSVHWIVASGRAMVNDPEKPMRIVGVTLDATDHHLAQAALLLTEKMAAVGSLASSISHEINNPLEAVTNLIFIARQTEDATARNEFLDMAERELRRAANITSQTLRFHHQSSKPRETTASELFDTVLTIYQGRLVNSQVRVERRERTTRTVLCFDGEIRQVLNNLVDNAIDALPPSDGRLLLRVREGSRTSACGTETATPGLWITVADTGAGMTPRVFRRLFDPFFTTKGIGGTGLGLWISREIIERHQGTMRARSREGQGTIFRVFLPFNIAPASAKSA